MCQKSRQRKEEKKVVSKKSKKKSLSLGGTGGKKKAMSTLLSLSMLVRASMSKPVRGTPQMSICIFGCTRAKMFMFGST